MDCKIFKYKKLLIFCPHEDDEINLVGGLLLELKKINCSIRVVFSTNGDYYIKGKYRIREAINSLRILGIGKTNITFLGYPDQDQCNDNHLYMTDDNFISHNGLKYTYMPDGLEYHYIKHQEHCLINKKNFIGDIEELILEDKADYIICVDYDSHCDHRALHLSFETAMGRVLNSTDYRPIVLKAFAYPTTYKGVKDFKSGSLGISEFNKEDKALYRLQNPYYKWENRLCFNTRDVTSEKLLLFNKLFKAIMQHKSQQFIDEAYSVINSDQVFFLRRTDNLLYNARVKVSSGDKKYLNDFMLFDSSNIMKGYSSFPIIDKGYTRINDNDRYISINFRNKVNIEELNIYEYVNCKTNLDYITLEYDGCSRKCIVSKDNFVYHLNNLGIKNIKSIKIIFPSNIDISELELFDSNTVYENHINDNHIKPLSISDRLIFMFDDMIIYSCHKVNKYFNQYKKCG